MWSHRQTAVSAEQQTLPTDRAGRKGFQLKLLSPSSCRARCFSVVSIRSIQPGSSPRASRIVRINPRLRAVVSSSRPARDIDVLDIGVLERETDVFAAALDGGPVVELVHWRMPWGRLG